MKFAVLPMMLALGGARAAADRSVAYELAPEVTAGAITALDVTIRLHADASGVTRLDWADRWAGDDKLGQWARTIRIEGGRSTTVAPNGGRIVRSAPGAPLVMRYRIVSAYAEDPSVDDSEQTRPVVRPGWFYSVGEALYARPADRDDAPARFSWKGPPGIGFASDTEHATGLLGRRLTVGGMLESIAIGGRALSVSTVTLNGAPVRIAHIGRFGFDVHAFDTAAQKVVAAERDFWGDASPGPFLITAIPLASRPGRMSYGGTGRGDAFATWIDRNADLPSLTWLLAHEYFHTWNSRQLGSMPDAKEAESYWMSEGFTDFYARRLMLRAGLWTPEKFAADWNEMLRAYAASAFRSVGNAATAAQFWSGDEAAQKIPYQRGAMLAALWDRQLRARGSSGLDTVLRAQRTRIAATAKPPELTKAFAAEMARFGIDIDPDVARYLTRGAPLVLPETTFGDCARLVTRDLPVFERGWDSEATAKRDNVFAGVDPSSNAYRAGLRDGMKFLRRAGGEPGDATIDYSLEVQDGPTKRTITFRPAGKATIPTQHLELDTAKFAADPGRCTAALAG